MTEPRLPPLPPQEWPPEMREALAALHPPVIRHPLPPADPSRPKALNALGMLAHHPELATAYNTFNGHVLFGSTITPRQRELLVLRVASRREAEYEWAQHLVVAGDAGITSAETDQLARGETDDWSDLDRGLLDAADELLEHARIADTTWDTLARELDHRQLMDVVFTVGAYDLLAMAFRTFDVQVDADLRKWYSPE